MWKVTICYHTVDCVTGKMRPDPKFISKIFDTKSQCEQYSFRFNTRRRVLMWTYIERFIGHLDQWLE